MTSQSALALAQQWREKAARIREKWKGIPTGGNIAMHAAAAIETCAEDLEMEVTKQSDEK